MKPEQLSISNYAPRSGKPGSPLTGCFDVSLENGLTQFKGVWSVRTRSETVDCLASRGITKAGETAYDPHVTFADDDARYSWQRSVLAALRPVRAKAEADGGNERLTRWSGSNDPRSSQIQRAARAAGRPHSPARQ